IAGPVLLVLASVATAQETVNSPARDHQQASQSSAAATTSPMIETWRYVWQNGAWWYYQPNGQWLVYTDGVWTFYQPGVVSVPAYASTPRYGNPVYAPQYYGYPYSYYSSQPGELAPPGFWNGPNRPGAGWVNGFFS